MKSHLPKESEELIHLLNQVKESIENGNDTAQFIVNLGLKKGISGYSYHTVPAVIHCWLRNQNSFKSGIFEIVECGGDTDTTASILGGIIGARVGLEGIPKDWIHHIIDYPRNIDWIIELSLQLSQVKLTKQKGTPLNLSIFSLLVRNIIFGMIVIGHGLRRLLPPY